MGLLKKDLCDTGDLSNEGLAEVLTRGLRFRETVSANPLLGKYVGLLFLEASTRTRVSFQMASEALGARVIIVDPETASLQKGETILDTVKTLEAEGLDYLVMRTSAPFLPHLIARQTSLRIINAGDGQHSHPTQALADVLALSSAKDPTKNEVRPEELPSLLSGFRITFTGDVRHSRVFRSTADLLSRCGAIVGVCTYGTLGLRYADSFPGIHSWDTPPQRLENYIDVVYPLRVQMERLKSLPFGSLEEYRATCGTTHLAEGQWLMHCGPFNRNVEVSGELVYSEKSLILEQVKWGYRARVGLMAAMEADK